LKIVDDENVLQEVDEKITIIVYTSNPNDSIVTIKDAQFELGIYNFNLRLRGGCAGGTLHVTVRPANTSIISGNVTEIKP
jgi:hypothetical protein